jgi:hypothetical protein
VPRPAGSAVSEPRPAGSALRTATPSVLAIVPLALALAITGCGYKAGGPYRPGIKTVFVAMAESKEFRRDLEFTLTEYLKKRLATDTPYRLADRQNADTILETEVLEERQMAWAPDFETRQPREKQLTLAVRVRWKDIRTGRILVDQPVLLQSADYSLQLGETEAFAQERALDRMAGRIIALMYDDW